MMYFAFFLYLIYRGEDDYYILTKGDNNFVDDRALYAEDQIWLHKKDLMGKIQG